MDTRYGCGTESCILADTSPERLKSILGCQGDTAIKYIEKLANREGIHTERWIVEGNPAEEIVRAAREKGMDIKDAASFEAVPGHGIRVVIDGKDVLVGNRRLMQINGLDTAHLEQNIQILEIQGKTAMLVAANKTVMGIIAVADTLKENSAEAVAELKKIGVETIMLTGDNERTAKAIALQVGIERVIANVASRRKGRGNKEIAGRGKGCCNGRRWHK